MATRRSARASLNRHRAEMDVELPKRAEARARAAQIAYEADVRRRRGRAGSARPDAGRGHQPVRAQGAQQDRYAKADTSPRPSISIDQFVPYAREASPFATRWTQMDLPLKTSEINVPADGARRGRGPGQRTLQARHPPGTSPTASSARPSRPIAGIADAAHAVARAGPGLRRLRRRRGHLGRPHRRPGDQRRRPVPARLRQRRAAARRVASRRDRRGERHHRRRHHARTVVDRGDRHGDTLHVYAAQTDQPRCGGYAPGPTASSWYWHPWVWSLLYAAQVDSPEPAR